MELNKEPFPNRYLAQFTRFIHTNIHIPELENLVIKSFDEFISRNLLQYPVVKISKIHFTGSIAYTFDQQLIKVMHNHKLQLGRITKDPMQDLVSFHTKVN